jgi:hypothetical protein
LAASALVDLRTDHAAAGRSQKGLQTWRRSSKGDGSTSTRRSTSNFSRARTPGTTAAARVRFAKDAWDDYHDSACITDLEAFLENHRAKAPAITFAMIVDASRDQQDRLDNWWMELMVEGMGKP